MTRVHCGRDADGEGVASKASDPGKRAVNSNSPELGIPPPRGLLATMWEVVSNAVGADAGWVGAKPRGAAPTR